MDEFDINAIGKGAIHVADPNDFAFGAANTPPYDWSKPYAMPRPVTISNQGSSESCVGQTAAKMAEFMFGNPRSARYVYSQIFLPNGGAMVRDGVNIVANQIIETEAQLPSAPETEANMRSGAGRVIAPMPARKVYALIANNIDDVAAAIRDHGVVSLAVYGNNDGWHQANVVPPKDFNGVAWGHDVMGCKIKMDGGKKYIGFANHWSLAWGEGGYGWLGEDYFDAGMVICTYAITGNYVMPIPFKAGLTAAQQSAIQALVLKGVRNWTPQDIANWGYATNHAPLPKA